MWDPCREGRCCCTLTFTLDTPWTLCWTAGLYKPVGEFWRAHVPKLPSSLAKFIEVGISKPLAFLPKARLSPKAGVAV